MKRLARLVLRVYWLADVWTDASSVLRTAPIHGLVRAWRSRRQMRRLHDDCMARWSRMPPEERLGYIHPTSPWKPPGWTLEKYLARVEREQADKAH